MNGSLWKIGDLARRTRLTVRTLHHYEEIGLLDPPARTDSGHRLYGEADVVRLQQIVSLRHLGFSLPEIRRCLEGAELSVLGVIELQLGRVREQLAAQQRLCRRLEVIAERLRSAERVSVEEFIQAIQETTMANQYYTPEQLREIEERGRSLGAEQIRHAEQVAWPELIAAVKAEMAHGTDPADPRVRELARRWKALVDEFTGGNAEIERSLGRMWREETTIHGTETAPMREMMAYVFRAFEAD